MAASEVDFQIRLVRELTGLWSELQKQMDEALGSSEISEQLEDNCMALKTKIAQIKQLAKEAIGEQFSCAGSIVKVLLGVPTLDLLKNQSPIVISNLRNVWHDVYIALNELAGNLKIERERKGGRKKSSSLISRLGGRR